MVPPKMSRPGTSGSFGVESAPVAATSTSALTGPCEVSTFHCDRSGFHTAEVSSQSKTIRLRRPSESTTPRR